MNRQGTPAGRDSAGRGQPYRCPSGKGGPGILEGRQQLAHGAGWRAGDGVSYGEKPRTRMPLALA